MNDVSAVVLSIGEETTDRAIRSLATQTLPVQETWQINNVSPFYKALNLGASKVRTPFFIQVDADMVLDADCVPTLRQCMVEGVGTTIGYLRDPLRGLTAGIKMFRKTCFEQVQFKNTITPDTDFAQDIHVRGWQTVYALRIDGCQEFLHTFGEHKPDYTPSYTYFKYLLEGGRYLYRNVPKELRGHFMELQSSGHEKAVIAQLALLNGIFRREKHDLLQPVFETGDYRILQKLIESREHGSIGDYTIPQLHSLKPKRIFIEFYRLGVEFRRQGSFGLFKECFNSLAADMSHSAWVARFGLCRGLLWEKDSIGLRRDYKLLMDFWGDGGTRLLRRAHSVFKKHFH